MEHTTGTDTSKNMSELLVNKFLLNYIHYAFYRLLKITSTKRGNTRKLDFNFISHILTYSNIHSYIRRHYKILIEM